MATPKSHFDTIKEGGQDIEDLLDWGFNLKRWLRTDLSDSLLSAVWTLPPDIQIDPGGGSGVIGTVVYVWLDTSLCSDNVEYQCIVDVTTTKGRNWRARLDILVRDVTAEP